jgi:hypothetical protein
MLCWPPLLRSIIISPHSSTSRDAVSPRMTRHHSSGEARMHPYRAMETQESKGYASYSDLPVESQRSRSRSDSEKPPDGPVWRPF